MTRRPCCILLDSPHPIFPPFPPASHTLRCIPFRSSYLAARPRACPPLRLSISGTFPQSPFPHSPTSHLDRSRALSCDPAIQRPVALVCSCLDVMMSMSVVVSLISFLISLLIPILILALILLPRPRCLDRDLYDYLHSISILTCTCIRDSYHLL
ncbi:hypothetical protein GY45DRAFT_185201 [Cubamyces sp. BRFM 1775]|nr:hypothetical protein GY45DRAFT_185201 [Cubamyces sp. BRFM 1775]